MKALPVLICLLSSCFLAGCKSGADVTGKWTGSMADTGDPNSPGAQMAAKMLGNVSLEIKKDHTFALTMMLPFEGTWTQSGSTLSLTMTKAMGMDVSSLKNSSGNKSAGSDKPLVLTVSSDGSTLTGQDPSGKGSLTFKRDKGS